ncbi:peptidylprolyl isomerase [Halanaerobium hydrogeniformans]|uniref:Peptidyl-prolyl cis-trans isomerase n=1 Tax=Halanaerobium hydrogeniformans TaxID=656519 RepID=E4RLM3_HALHG|nr:peptidylprolyl isomerase [Halanaerobium hydrogeniformans]ADQ14937.1 Peptidylprolyl isomerase [Halanaerobium hydrogeniformans]
MDKNPEVKIILNNGEEIKLELYPEQAENTVNNFIDLAEKDYYNGLKFHRVIKGFMIQGGCPEGTGTGNPGYAIKGEFASNGYDNDLSHTRGVISMARSQNPNSAGSQFFIVHQNAPHLDGQYAAFGEVIEGMDAVDKIADVKTDARDMPLEDQIIEKVEVELFGQEYDAPEKV